MNEKEILLIDGHNLIYRAYHGNQNKLTTADGIPTNALLTTIKMVRNLSKNFSFDYGMFLLDGDEGTFRDDIDSTYKAQRKPMPDDLKIQLPLIQEGISLLGWPVTVASRVEADDIIGTVAVRASNKGNKVKIISGDKDFRAIVNDNITVIDTMRNIHYNRQQVFLTMGVYPEQVRDYLSLTGDGADNIEGIDGLGPKTAAKLLMEYKDIDGIIANLSSIKGVMQQRIRDAHENGNLHKYRSLVTLKTDSDITLGRADCIVTPTKDDEFIQFCTRYELHSLIATPKSSHPAPR